MQHIDQLLKSLTPTEAIFHILTYSGRTKLDYSEEIKYLLSKGAHMVDDVFGTLIEHAEFSNASVDTILICKRLVKKKNVKFQSK